MSVRPKVLELLMAAVLAAVPPAARALEPGETAGPGISYALPITPQWQARLGVAGEARPLLRPEAELPGRSLSLFGDYYIPRAYGLRATGGLVLGSGHRPGATLWPALGQGAGFPRTGPAAWWRDEPAPGDASSLAAEASPYFGVGYTGLAVRGSLGFFADVGLRGLKPRSSVQLGGNTGSGWRSEPAPDIWRPWREWRFEPVLQLGVSYTF